MTKSTQKSGEDCKNATACSGNNTNTTFKQDKASRQDRPRYFERPDPDAEPMGFAHVLLILISSHIGVRSRKNRHQDFQRANGLHIFIAAVIYFLCIIIALIVLVNAISA